MRDRKASVLLSILLAFCVIVVTGCGGSGGAPGEGGTQAPLASGSDTHPEWSPDGSSIAFISNREGVRAGTPINFEIYRAAADGSGEQRLTSNQAFEAEVAWSPDGTRILFKSYRDGNDEVYSMAADGSKQQNLTRSEASDGGATWSPDGQTILFDSDRDGSDVPRFYLMDADGSKVRQLAHDPGSGHSAAWSPDGGWIVFVSNRDGNGEIYLMHADGSNVRRLTDDPRENGYPRWSPDGATIAHTVGSFDSDRWAVVLTDAQGGDSREVIVDTDSGNVAWSPDGQRLLFGRYSRYGESGGEDSRLFVFSLETRQEAAFPLAGR